MSNQLHQMSKADRVDFALERCRHNSFNRQYYTVDLPLDDFMLSLLKFLNRAVAKGAGLGMGPDALFAEMMKKVPPFQRDNNKWTAQMQGAYVRNLLLGMKSPPLVLYTLEDGKANCWLLDGLQRITALCRFFGDDDMVLDFDAGVTLTAKEVRDTPTFERMMWNLAVPIRVYEFDSEAHAIEHYIDINENMTHSPEDIEKAKRYLLSGE